jgi:hypothetical protein
MQRRLVRIELGVRNPTGQDGFLIVAPRDEALEWDLRHEIASTSLSWLAERRAWWISASYLPTVRTILERFDDLEVLGAPPPEPVAAVEPVPAPAPALPARFPILARVAEILRRPLATLNGFADRAASNR